VAERDDLDELTAIKLALQLLEHRTALSDYQHALLDTALQATDRLNTRLLERVSAAKQRALRDQARHLRAHDHQHDRADAGQEAVVAQNRVFPARTEPMWHAASP
jgi:hypothetical protein